jgi:hypothetical protein
LWFGDLSEPRAIDRIGLSQLVRASLFPEALRAVEEPAPPPAPTTATPAPAPAPAPAP